MSNCLDFFQYGNIRIEICQGDITEEKVDAIVNAANADLQHGGGVAGAIVRKGGKIINVESAKWIAEHGRVAHKFPAYTSAGLLPAKMIIHAVGPIWGEGNEDLKLSDTVMGSLELAKKLDLSSISFPAISTGIYGFPKERAARIILMSQMKWSTEHSDEDQPLRLIRNILLDDTTVQVFQTIFHELTS